MLTIGNGKRHEVLTEHQVHLLRTALAYAAQQMRKDQNNARDQFAHASARQWARTSRLFSDLFGLVESLDDDDGDDDDEPSVMGAGAARRPVGGGSDISDAPLPDAPPADAADHPDAAAS